MKNSTKMAALARRRLRNPAAVRLAALKSYRALGKVARQLVRAIIVDGVPVSQALADQKNGGRMWNSRPVIDCLQAYGYRPPDKPLPAPSKPYQPAEPLPEAPEVPCQRCGEVGRHTARHNSDLVCNRCLCEAGNIWVSRMPAEAEPAAAPPYNVNDGPRCPQCHLVICSHPRPVIVPGDPQPTQFLHRQIVPRSQDLDYWQREIDEDRARRAAATSTATDARSAVLRELARRELSGDY